MATVYKREVKDWRGVVIGVDVGRFFPIEAHAAADRAEALLEGINPAGFVPFGDKGEPFDPPEEWPSDKDAEEYAPQAVSTEYAAGHVLPPNCDFVSHGEALAHAQHRAAEGGEGCDSVACSITQGVSD